MRPIGVDLFAGAGGLSLGFEQAGFDVAAAIEIDPIHATVHKFNFPGSTIIPRSVANLAGDAIRKEAGIPYGGVDVVFGGAPCQGFSLIGQRALADPRNVLVQEFVRLIDELKASYFVFENVKGLTVGRHRRFLEEVIEAFEQKGYQVRKPWRVLNAVEYGVPQNRQRLFLIGARKGLPLPEYPTPTTRPVGTCGDLIALAPTPTCRDALGDIPEAEDFEALLTADAVRTSQWGEPSAYAREMRCLDNRSWHQGYPRRWDPTILTSSMRTEHSEISRRRFSETDAGSVEPISRFFKLASNGVSNTLRAGTDSARGAFTSPRPIHYSSQRCITVREMARLHGFPDWFRFHETKWHGARQVGNAVPPPLARAVASKIVEALGLSIECPSQVLELGDPATLGIGMSEAANLWGIPVPIGRRDRKSGATKRKQLEIERLRLTEIREEARG